MGPADDRYIEVIGEGRYVESASQYVCTLTITVHARRREQVTQVLGELKDRCAAALREAGVPADEIADGGAEVAQPAWYGRRWATQALTITTSDLARLNQAVCALEPLFRSKRHHLNTEMRQPVFDRDADAVAAAQREALAQAQRKARLLAEEGGLTLGPIIQIEELSMARRASGALGDIDRRGDTGRFSRAGDVAVDYMVSADWDMPRPRIEEPSRTIWVRYRVRFAVGPA